MANELRKIAFNLTEIHSALDILATKTGKAVPSDPVTSIKPDGGGRLAVKFGEASDVLINIAEKELITALLVFCQDKKIPVPKGGKKVLKVEGSGATLLIKLG